MMNANEAAVPSADAATRVIVYEQPLNERMRNFLRLDFLYQQAVHHHTKSDPWSTRAAVARCSRSSPSPSAATCAARC